MKTKWVIALVAVVLGGSALADPIVKKVQIVVVQPVVVRPQLSQITACRWVKDTSGIPDPSRPMLVLSCLPKP